LLGEIQEFQSHPSDSRTPIGVRAIGDLVHCTLIST
jgi:hypothetical protein